MGYKLPIYLPLYLLNIMQPTYYDALPNSLRDSNVSPKLKTMNEQGVRAAPELATL